MTNKVVESYEIAKRTLDTLFPDADVKNIKGNKIRTRRYLDENGAPLARIDSTDKRTVYTIFT